MATADADNLARIVHIICLLESKPESMQFRYALGGCP